MHGQETNFASELKRTGRAFVLGGGTDFYGKICGQLEELGMQETKLFIGENLSLDGEQVLSGSLETIQGAEGSAAGGPLCGMERSAPADVTWSLG